MGNGKTIAIASLVAIASGALVVLLDRAHEAPELPVPTAARPTAPAIPAPVGHAQALARAPLTFNPAPILPTAPGRTNPFIAVPADNMLTFEVQKGGLAVAFGDVLLGKVEEGWHGTRGRFDTPLPRLWDKPEIPYSISPDLVNPARVEQAVAYYRDHTPIRLVPYSGQPDSIVFETGDENCLSNLGKVGGAQPIKLAPKCGVPEIIHEVMHALGFVHEQSRPDRDRFVQVQWGNIEEQYQSQFAMVSEAFTEAMRGSNFDYHSVMLYRPDIFAAHAGSPTMLSTGSEQISPVNEGLSVEDIRRLNQLYGAE